jgi:uncharacterized integral membrane protein (TIGR00698 family)
MKLDEEQSFKNRLSYYESLDSLEGVSPPPEKSAPTFFLNIPFGSLLYSTYPGMLAAGTIAIAASWLSHKYTAPVMLYALLLGIAFAFLSDNDRCKRGINFASRTILRIGVALLGLRISATQISDLGLMPVAAVIIGVMTTMGLGYCLSRKMKLGHEFGLLTGGAVAICGASAALAISTSLSKYLHKERDTVLTVIGVTSLSTIAMIFYPLLASWLALSDVEAGVFIGGTIHDVAQVVGAGYIISQETGDVSTYVKLLRVALLVPVVIILSLVFLKSRNTDSTRTKPVFPLFLIVFCALVAINSLITVPDIVKEAATTTSSWCLVTAISALGMKTSLRELTNVGWKPVIMMVAETAWIAGLVLAIITFMR